MSINLKLRVPAVCVNRARVRMLATSMAIVSSIAVPVATVAAISTVHAAFPVVALTQTQDDPSLEQTVTDAEDVVTLGTQKVFDHGHADLGPVVNTDSGETRFLVRDDSEFPPKWRHLSDTVFLVDDSAKQTLPEESQSFEFTGAKPGSQVWVIPQSEVHGVPWLGWNTQNPTLTKTADRGITLEFAGHEGDGQFSLFLQNGGFAEPQVLWTSAKNESQPMWVDLNTHTHANWVFTKPGVHKVAVRALIPLLDGTTKEITEVLTFAVGKESLEKAKSAQWDGEFLPSSTKSGDKGASASTKTKDALAEENSSSVAVWIFIAMILIALGFVIAGLRMRASAKKRKETAAQNGQR